ncbi:hypothetical protein ILUMI_14650 [Ignelater luminosus]|uniref:Uncharacterized protein n=1 Tax=Ignelater luminosus TaxID=2038154 RepID=A0A8K0GAQ7_IGNLU|nr:hypothetical protein ILUMI_14650 [Ignelater luminosus]
MIYYDFKKGLSAYECKESSDLAFSKQASSLAAIYRWFKEFEHKGPSVKHQKGTERPPTAVTEENIAAVKKINENDTA